MKRVATLLLCLALSAGAGCTTTEQTTPVGLPRIGEPVEEQSVREAMIAHIDEAWPQLQSALVNSRETAPVSPETAERSTPGTPTVVWRYVRDTPEDADPWLGVARVLDRTQYVVPVLVDGAPVASLLCDDHAGDWRAWPELNYASLASDALDLLAAHFNSSEFEWCYVYNRGMWVVARRDGQTAAVYIDPQPGHRVEDAPTGVLSGGELREWMDYPLGR